MRRGTSTQRRFGTSSLGEAWTQAMSMFKWMAVLKMDNCFINVVRKWKTKKKYVWKRCQCGLTRDRIGDFIAVMKGEQSWELYILGDVIKGKEKGTGWMIIGITKITKGERSGKLPPWLSVISPLRWFLHCGIGLAGIH